MNNEEKILALLETMSDRQTKTEALLEAVNDRQTKTEALLETMNDRQTKTEVLLAEMRAETNERFDKIENRLENLEDRIERVEGTVTRIENDHGMKLGALADGYTQLAGQYTRLNDRLSTQEEFVLRRVFAK